MTTQSIRQSATALFLGAALVVAAAPLGAQPPTLVVDQQQPTVDAGATTFAIGGASEQKLAQTFTVGVGGRLAEVRLPIGCESGRLDVEIQGTMATGEPDGTTLVRRSFRADALPGVVPATFVAFALPRRLTVAPGDVLAIVLSNATGTCGVASSPDGDSYSAGRAWYDARPNPPGWLTLSPGSPEDDLPFQTVVRVH